MDVRDQWIDWIYSMPESNFIQQDSEHSIGAGMPLRKRLIRILSRIWGPNVWLIIVSAILCAIFHRWVDLFLVIVLFLGYVGMTVWKDYQAGKKFTFFHKKGERSG